MAYIPTGTRTHTYTSSYENGYTHCRSVDQVTSAVIHKRDFLADAPLNVRGYWATAVSGDAFYVMDMAHNVAGENRPFPLLVFGQTCGNWYYWSSKGFKPSHAFNALLGSLPQDKLVGVPIENALRVLPKEGYVSFTAEMLK